MLFYTFGLSFYRSILPNYCYYSTCRAVEGANCTFSLNQSSLHVHCNETRYTDEVQDSSSYLLLVVQLVNSSLSLPAILISGPLSDLKGRKVILIAAILASTVSALVYCFIEMFSLPPLFILFPSALDGIFGNHTVVILGVSAMAADLSDTKCRTFRMGTVEGCLLIGYLVSQFVSGYIIDALGFFWSFVFLFIVWSLALVSARYIPESFHGGNGESNSNFRDILTKSLTPLRLFKQNKNRIRFVVFLVAYVFVVEDVDSIRSIFSLYVLAPPLCWGPRLQGFYFGLIYLSKLIGVYLILPLLVLFQVSDPFLLLLGAIDCALVFGLTGVYQKEWWLLGVVPPTGVLASLGVPSARSGMSKLVSAHEQGSMLTILEFMNALTNIASVVTLNAIYPALRSFHSSYCFYIISATSLVPCAAVLLLMAYEFHQRRRRRRKRYKLGFASDENEPLIRQSLIAN